MGDGIFKSDDWDTYKATNHISHSSSVRDIMNCGVHNVQKDWMPFKITRECCNSTQHPNSTPIVIGLDGTGSMSRVLSVASKRVGDTVLEILNRDVCSDPMIMYAVIDDYVSSYRKCLQVTQFESDIRIAEQMKQLSFIEQGGGNGYESYADLWYFLRYHTKCDAFNQGRKGIVFTIGDDGVQKTISPSEVEDIFGDTIEEHIKVDKLLSELNRNWEVYHLNVLGGSCYSEVLSQWKGLLGNHSIEVEDVDSIPEIIVSILQTLKGDSISSIVSSWDGSTSVAVQKAIQNLAVPSAGNSGDVVVF